MQKDLSKLEQKVSESENIPPKIKKYSSSSEEKKIVYIEYSFKKFYENLQEELGIPLDPVLAREIYNRIPEDRCQKICSEVANEILGQEEYEAGKEYLRRIRRKQNEMKSATEVYENSK